MTDTGTCESVVNDGQDRGHDQWPAQAGPSGLQEHLTAVLGSHLSSVMGEFWVASYRMPTSPGQLAEAFWQPTSMKPLSARSSNQFPQSGEFRLWTVL